MDLKSAILNKLPQVFFFKFEMDNHADTVSKLLEKEGSEDTVGIYTTKFDEWTAEFDANDKESTKHDKHDTLRYTVKASTLEAEIVMMMKQNYKKQEKK